MIPGPFLVTIAPVEAAGMGGIGLAALMLIGLLALGSPGSCSAVNSPSHARAQTTLTQTIPTAQNEQRINGSATDPFATGMSTETSTSNEMTPEPIKTTTSAEEVQSVSASESVTVKSPTETIMPDEIVQIESIDSNRACLISTIKGFSAFSYTYPPEIVEIFPISTEGLNIECSKGLCKGYITDNQMVEHEFRQDIYFINSSRENIDIYFTGRERYTSFARKLVTLIHIQDDTNYQQDGTNTLATPQPQENLTTETKFSSISPPYKSRLFSRAELDKMADIVVAMMNRDYEKIERENN